MFDCDFDSKEELERTQIIYDEDLFSFGNDNSIESTDSTSSIEFDAGKVENQRYVDSSNATIKRKSIASRLDFKVKIRNSNNNPKRMIVNSSNKKSTNKYDILKEIGSGTYGKVYSARDNRDNRIIAVKRIICEMKTLQSVRKFWEERKKKKLKILTTNSMCIDFNRKQKWNSWHVNKSIYVKWMIAIILSAY